MKYRLFKRKKSNQFFFQILTDNDVKVLDSEGYEAKDGRNNGLRSVVENGGNAGRYEKRTEGGQHYFILKAGNGQEIARSAKYNSEGEADSAIAMCISEIPGLAPGESTSAESTTTTTTIITETTAGQSVEDGTKIVAANRSANIEIDAPPPAEGDAAPKKKRKKRTGPKKEKVEKVYLSNGEYYFNDITYQVFRSGNGKHYFTFKNAEEKTIFLNASVRGFETQEEAENAVADVMLYSPYEANYEGKTTKNGKYYFYITDGAGTNLGKSFFYNTTQDMQDAIGTLLGNEEAIAAAQASGKGAARAPRRDDDYLACAEYEGAAGWHTFKKEDEFYFAYNGEDGKTLLRSEGYTTEKARDNGIESVKKNAPIDARWSTKAVAGKYFYMLKAGNHQEIARSCPHDSEKSSNWIWSEVMNPPAKKEAAPAANIDEYLECSAYKGGSGFHKFEKDGEYYFGYNDDDGNTILRSEGYTTEKARDNGIESVKKNAVIEERWKTIEEDGKYYRILKAGNHQEIGRSCPADDASGPAWAWMWSTFSVSKTVAPAEIPDPEPIVFEEPAAPASIDEYLECSAYKGESGFHKFEKDGEYYFGYNDDGGNTILRSEGYTTEKARDNGIESVKKNAVIEKRWSTVEEDGKFFRVLKAGNHQEIGRSCPADDASGPAWAWMWGSFALAKTVAPTEVPDPEPIVFEEPVVVEVKTEAEKEDDYLPCKEYEGHAVNDKINNVALFKHENGQFYFAVYNTDGSVRLRSEGFGTAKGRDVELSGVLKNLNNDDMYKTIKRGKYSMNILYDKTGREVGRSCLQKEKPAAPPVVAAAPVAAAVPVVKKTQEEKEDDYLPCKEYEGKTVTDKANNIALFKHENGQYYFVVYNSDGSVRLRSEGFNSPENRKVELDGVIAYLGNSDMMRTIEKGKYRMHILYDHEGREVGRSCLETVKAPVAAPVAAVATAAAVASTVKVEKEVDKEDDYLACKEYEGRKVNDKQNNVALFKHANGQFYFAVYRPDGSVRLRSEGFRKAKQRDVELSGVLKNIDKKDMYKTIEKGKYSMHILYDKTGREVGRSCLEKEAQPIIPVAAVAAAAVAAAPVVIPAAKKKVVVEKKTPVAAAATTATTAAESSGGFNWWWLLGLLPLILFALCYFTDCCSGCGKAEVKKPVIETPAAPAPEPDPVPEPEPEPEPVAAVCACGGNDNFIFNPQSGTPKVLTRLGTNPEFGNSHGLDGAGFYNKLKKAYSSSSRDKKFLDDLFKGMGYSGFGEASADLFSQTSVPKGTVGNMGYSSKHRTLHARLNATSSKDLEAFRIDAANGCDIHFMKTCGNHFFFCPN